MILHPQPNESRQQRRARERRERKQATRPGPNLPERVVEVELNRTVIDDGPGEAEVWWCAVWGLRGDSSGTEDSSDDLAGLVAAIINDLQLGLGSRYVIRLDWMIGGDPPDGERVEDAITELGVRLPELVP